MSGRFHVPIDTDALHDARADGTEATAMCGVSRVPYSSEQVRTAKPCYDCVQLVIRERDALRARVVELEAVQR